MLTAYIVAAHPETVTLYHGTTEMAAQDILQNGWKSSDGHAVAERIGKLYGVDPDALYNHEWNAFANSYRATDDKVYFATDLNIARSYADSRSEMVMDALRTVFRMKYEKAPESMTYNMGTDWAKEEAQKIDQPAMLTIDCPWALCESNYPNAQPGALEEYGIEGTITLTPDQLRGIPVHRVGL